ncbi:sulfoxide reductase heme-binding subunit YedZ [Methylicorpusculum oleiharenae]|uniref:sulfite oxidase heme-binding subunit YedZ n=1 Tax=Methylicorpusculum oleiharenae TaxID=1338687 RepID=UPI00135C88C0|nr:protein-methionine-sulfoxide reductase heme-binding subunit MsrQ [Methylicorpusculum oleiharenae]MCD2449606.1 sulfoxide reductase heme-binding subunit YedZ [Methylicorpusculum oleiharenae]
MIKFNQLKPGILIACWIPLLWLLLDIILDNLGGNAVQAVHIRLGDWSLRFLCIVLAITPLQTMTNWRGMSEYRRMFGLFTFIYATLHLLAYLVLDHYLVWPIIATDILESSYIWFGIAAYLIILALAVTTPKWVVKLMGKDWKKLHRFIYFAAGAAIMHYFWQLKGNLAEPLFYLSIIILLLGFRLLLSFKNRVINRLMLPKGRR